ncbi:MAG: hypothetical protein AAFQ68_03155, partial [Bacteroidota bacterium]
MSYSAVQSGKVRSASPEPLQASAEKLFVSHFITGLLLVFSVWCFESDLPGIWKYSGLILLGIQWIRYWRNVAYFVVRYWRYLYISLIYFIIIGIALSLFEQTETLFARMVEDDGCWNLLVFWVQFPLSVMVVWFLPYYLMFSDIY